MCTEFFKPSFFISYFLFPIDNLKSYGRSHRFKSFIARHFLFNNLALNLFILLVFVTESVIKFQNHLSRFFIT